MAPRDTAGPDIHEEHPDYHPPADRSQAADHSLDLTRPSLEALAYLLRHPEERPGRAHPSQFMWDFAVTLAPLHLAGDDDYEPCGSRGCAYGIAQLVWGAPEMGNGNLEDIAARFFRITPNAAYSIFLAWGEGHTTPEKVAQRIDRYLELKRAASAAND